MMEKRKLLSILKDEMKPALGVTEPISVALGAAKAYEAVGGELKSIRIVLDPALFKNGVSCAIPGTDEAGFEIAAVLGALKGDPDAGMEVLKNVKKEEVADAKSFVKRGFVTVLIKKGHNGLYVETEVKTDHGIGRTIIKNKHDHIILIEGNGKLKYSKSGKEKGYFNIKRLKLHDLIRFAKRIPYKDINFVMDAVEMNTKLAKEGLSGKWGINVGSNMWKLMKEGKIGNDVITLSQIYVAAATDARLGGAKLPAMSIAGSGTHGLTATLPISVVAQKLRIGKEKIARAIALSMLITIYMKTFTGRLSAFCGCSATAGSGASAGIVFMLGGDERDICNSIINMAADVSGIICDGANYGCALKTSTGVGSAFKAAFLALNGAAMPSEKGIVGRDVEQTIRNMGELSARGMLEIDSAILGIINKNGKYQFEDIESKKYYG
jgi:L-cysteine desulfidase